MGIYDRDYIRDDPRRRGGLAGAIARWREWSVTTWIILACVAVFVVDRAIPISAWPPVVVEARINRPSGPNVADVPIEDEDSFAGWRRPIVDLDTGAIVGFAQVVRMPPLHAWLHFSTFKGVLPEMQFWRLIGFQFLHASVAHLLFNMFGLWVFGSLVEGRLGRKRFLAFYLLCGIAGALLYLVLNLAGVVVEFMSVNEVVKVPGLLFNDPRTPLVGASAGVFGVLMAGAYIAPRERVYVFMILPVELRPLAYILVAGALYTLLTGGPNAGGEAGHLGGAIAGAYFIRRPHHLHGFFDFLGRVDPTSHHYRKGRSSTRRRAGAASALEEAEVDRILRKVREAGMDTLTSGEQSTLRRATRHQGGEP